MKLISKTELQQKLAVRRGAQPVTFVAKTVADLYKKGNPFGTVYKVSRVNGMVNFKYQNAVNRQREREDILPADFEAQPRKWGTRLPGLPFVEHKGELYLEVKVEKTLGHIYLTEEGKLLSKEEIGPFQKPFRSSGTQELVNEVILRDYKVEGIQSIAFGGEQYIIEENQTGNVELHDRFPV